MIDHVSIPVRNLEQAGRFYDEVLATLGLIRRKQRPGAIGYGPAERAAPVFWLLSRDEQGAAAPGLGLHLSFAAADRQAVDRFHATALGLGAGDAGAPGERPEYTQPFYGAFVIDLDGFKIEAVCRVDILGIRLERSPLAGATRMNKAVAVSLEHAFDSLTYVPDRRPDSTGIEDSFARVSDYRNGGVFVTHYAGASEWERHPHGDELVMVVDGETTLLLLLDGREVGHRLKAQSLLVVPENTWHRFESPEGVKVLTVTPQPTDHSIERPAD